MTMQTIGTINSVEAEVKDAVIMESLDHVFADLSVDVPNVPDVNSEDEDGLLSAEGNEPMHGSDSAGMADTGASPPKPGVDTSTLGPYDKEAYVNPVLMDVQLVFREGSGSYIKEIAYKTLCDGRMFSINYRHPTYDPLKQRVYNVGNVLYDKFTGLAIGDGDSDYSDESFLALMDRFDMVLLKGANKKRAIEAVYGRAGRETGRRIVNVDSNTTDDKDRALCKRIGLGTASFSFPFVYRNFQTYTNMLCSSLPSETGQPESSMFVHNIVCDDTRLRVFGRGRIVSICPNDHTYGGYSRFFTEERCALLNLAILDNLWMNRMDVTLRKQVRDAGDIHKMYRQRRYECMAASSVDDSGPLSSSAADYVNGDGCGGSGGGAIRRRSRAARRRNARPYANRRC